MSRGTIVPVLVALSMLAGCSKKSPYGKPDDHTRAIDSAAASRAQVAASASADPDAGITDPDQLIERGWSRHLQGQDAHLAFAHAIELLHISHPAVPRGSTTGPGRIEGQATTTDGTAAVIKVPTGLLFYRPGSGTVTGWRRLTGTLARPDAIVFHPVRPMLSIIVSTPAPTKQPAWGPGAAVHIVDSRAMTDLPAPDIDSSFVPVISSSGTRIAYLSGGTLHLLDVDAGKDRYAPLPLLDNTVPGAVLFAPDTKSFAVLDVVRTANGPRNAQVRLVNAADGHVLFTQKIETAFDNTVIPPAEPPPAMDFSADGSSFRYVDPTNGKLMAVDRTSGAAKPDAGQPPASAAPKPPVEVPLLDRTVCHLHGRVMPASACVAAAAPTSSSK